MAAALPLHSGEMHLGRQESNQLHSVSEAGEKALHLKSIRLNYQRKFEKVIQCTSHGQHLKLGETVTNASKLHSSLSSLSGDLCSCLSYLEPIGIHVNLK